MIKIIAILLSACVTFIYCDPSVILNMLEKLPTDIDIFCLLSFVCELLARTYFEPMTNNARLHKVK